MCYNTHRIAGRLAKVNQKEVTRSVNKRTTAFLLGSVLLCHASLVYGEVPDYNTVVEDTQKENKAVQMFETDDGKGNTVQVAAHQETLYVTARKTGIYTMPSDSSAELAAVSLGYEPDGKRRVSEGAGAAGRPVRADNRRKDVEVLPPAPG